MNEPYPKRHDYIGMKNMKIKWPLIAIGSCLGLVHGILSLFGIVQGWETVGWLSAAVVAITLSGISSGAPFLHGLLMGLCITLFTGLTQGLFIDLYLQSNPMYKEGLDPNQDYRMFVFRFIPVFGSIYGAVIGGLSWALHRVLAQF
ncbi:MAG: hypothetical protein RIB47_06055 [Cyclobacteriaceae bacterium]